MARQTINIGSTGNDGTGDKLRISFNKVNQNFGELYYDVSNTNIKVNSVYDLTNAAFDYANTIISENTNLTDVFNVANAAFGVANSIAGNVSISQLSNNSNYLTLDEAGVTHIPNRVTFGQIGLNPPDVVELSGNKVILWDQPGYFNYAIGIESDNMWFGVDEGASAQGFKWYAGNTELLQITRQGNVAFSANGHIFNRANSSGDGYGFDTLEIFPDNRYPQGLVIDPTAPNHIHLRGTGDQDNSITELYIGGENSHFRLPSGLNPAPIITSNGSSWVFFEDGTLSLPGNGTISYTPTTGSDWAGTPPTTIQEAIDRLAAAVKALNSTGA